MINVGGVLRLLHTIPIPSRDEKEVRQFAKSLPKDQNLQATEHQIKRAVRLVRKFK